MNNRKRVGKSGLQMSKFSLGAMTFCHSGSYGEISASKHELNSIIDVAIENEVNTFDTANVYGMGESERTLGRLLNERRNNCVISTKVRFPAVDKDKSGKLPNYGEYGLSRHSILESVHRSLKNLRTEYIDLLYLHMQDRMVPIEETLAALDSLVQSGKVRYIGISNFMAYRLVEALWKADTHGYVSLTAVQAPWSVIKRDIEDELLPAIKSFDLGLIVYSPLSRGFLSDKHQPGLPATSSRLQKWPEQWQQYDTDKNWLILNELHRIAKTHDTSVSSVALAWLASKRSVSSILLGVTSAKQLQDNLGSATLTLHREEIQLIDKISEPDFTYPCEFIKQYEQW
ncbi:aldo/keto reductase [Vibrio mediterranei]|uniref:aldo/keto reductase n=1 Tax=Vibrio mediterranei TaxID=689 RepID=UPI00148D720B|nr:aldo/keto reductase [Vibrio mediterranei]NOH31505.1 aldo/keto reductase [Vibrio mediterranei]